MKRAIEVILQEINDEALDVLFVNARLARVYRKELDTWDGPMIFCSPARFDTFYMDSNYWPKMQNYFVRSNVAYCDMLMGVDNFAKLLGAVRQNKIDNTAFHEKSQRDVVLIGKLLHDLEPNKSEAKRKKAAQDAGYFFGVLAKSESELIQKLGDLKTKIDDKPNEIQKFSGIFCDVEGTLLVDGQLNDSVLRLLKQYKEEGYQINLWTGGNVDELSEVLADVEVELGLDYCRLSSKYDYRWCQVEVVIDDLNQKEFTDRYSIFTNKYIKV